MSGIISIALAALAGGLGVLAVREALRLAPGAARWLAVAVEPLRRAGSEGHVPSRSERRRLGLLAAAVLLAIGLWFLGPAPAAPLAAAGPAAAGMLVARRAARYRAAVESGLPRVAVAIADGLAAGRSVRAALEGSVGSLTGPIATELARVLADLQLGASLEHALRGLRERLGSPRVDAFCAALLSQRLAGGDLVALLRRFAAAAEDRDRARADARSATAQARFTGMLIAAMPAGAALLAELLAPGFIAGLLANGVAVAMLIASVVVQAVGFAAIARLANVRAP